jgi:hypothetical protein
MDVSAPKLNAKEQSYLFQVQCKDARACSIHTVGPPIARDISGILDLFIRNAQIHFESGIEIEEVKHTWDMFYDGEDRIIEDFTEAWWIPKQILVTPLLISIEWMISSIGPGAEAPARVSPGKAALHRRRVREARLRAAAAKLHAESLAEAYFRKYGPEMLSDAESSLSET